MPFVSVSSGSPASSRCPPGRFNETSAFLVPIPKSGPPSTGCPQIMQARPKRVPKNGSFVPVAAQFSARHDSPPSQSSWRAPRPTPATTATPVGQHPPPKRPRHHEETTRTGEQELKEWWISRALRLQPEQRNGWVVAHMLDEYRREELYASACSLKTFEQ